MTYLHMLDHTEGIAVMDVDLPSLGHLHFHVVTPHLESGGALLVCQLGSHVFSSLIRGISELKAGLMAEGESSACRFGAALAQASPEKLKARREAAYARSPPRPQWPLEETVGFRISAWKLSPLILNAVLEGFSVSSIFSCNILIQLYRSMTAKGCGFIGLNCILNIGKYNFVSRR